MRKVVFVSNDFTLRIESLEEDMGSMRSLEFPSKNFETRKNKSEEEK